MKRTTPIDAKNAPAHNSARGNKIVGTKVTQYGSKKQKVRKWVPADGGAIKC